MSRKKKVAKSRPPMKQPQAFLVTLGGCVLGGAVTGGIIGIIAALVMKDSLFGLGGLVGAAGGIIIGYPIGVILGIVLVRRWIRREGPLWLAVPLCMVGAAGSLGVAELMHIALAISLPAYFVATPLLGTAGFFIGKRS
jgi:biotin transporter BioY